MGVFTLEIFTMICLMDREILNTLTKINILDSLEKVKKKEEEFITLVKALSLMDCGKMTKKQKEL